MVNPHEKSVPILDPLQKNKIVSWLVDIPMYTKKK